jgi:hypothetical protein
MGEPFIVKRASDESMRCTEEMPDDSIGYATEAFSLEYQIHYKEYRGLQSYKFHYNSFYRSLQK